jgi:hypothetical protein
MVTDTANRYGVNIGGVTITIAIIVCKATISRRPHVDIPLTIPSLKIYSPCIDFLEKVL